MDHTEFREVKIIDVWHDMSMGHPLNWLEQKLSESKNTDIVIHGPQEAVPMLGSFFNLFCIENNIDNYEAILAFIAWIRNHLDNNNNKFIFITGRADKPCYNTAYKTSMEECARIDHIVDGIFDEVYYWDTYWFMNGITDYTAHISYPLPYADKKPEYVFCCKNGKGHKHRFEFMECLAQYDLIENNLITWRSNHQRKGKFWQEKIISPGEDAENDPEDGNYSAGEPIGYYDCFIDVITESSCIEVFLTEKTLKPILAERPFIILGSPYTQTHLVDMGFQLYDELFDYSFDLHRDSRVRSQDIAIQLSDINNNFDDLYHISPLDSIRKKASHNLFNLCKIIMDETRLPPKKYLTEHSIHKINEARKAAKLIQKRLARRSIQSQ